MTLRTMAVVGLFDRLDDVDRRAGIRHDHRPSEQATSLRRLRTIFVPAQVVFSVVQLAIGAWVIGTIFLVLAGCVWVMFGQMANRLEDRP